MTFLDVDVKGPLVSVSATVDEGKRVCLDGRNRIIVATGRKIPMCRKSGVFVLQ